jgi:hypothetical protein
MLTTSCGVAVDAVSLLLHRSHAVDAFTVARGSIIVTALMRWNASIIVGPGTWAWDDVGTWNG